jgi:hypothetical protein
MKIIKSIYKWAKEIFQESLNQLFTLLGFFIAWLTLTGEARTIVGYAIIWTTIVWLLTINFRSGEDD